MPAGQPGIDNRWRRILVPSKIHKDNRERLFCLEDRQPYAPRRFEVQLGVEDVRDEREPMGWSRSKGKPQATGGRAGASGKTFGHGGRLGSRLVLQEEAEGRFRGDGLLLDGQVVLTKIGSLVKELAEVQRDAQVLAAHVVCTNGVVVGHASLLGQPFAATRGGLEAGRTGSCIDERLDAMVA